MRGFRRLRARRAPAAALRTVTFAGALAAALAGCELEREPSARDSAAVRAAHAEFDSLTRVARGESPRAPAVPPALPAAGDSAEETVAPAAPPIDAQDPPDTAAAPEPTPPELLALRTALAIPVQGVAAADLRDSFDEARGATRVHNAIDILAPRGTPVLAATDGRLLRLLTSENGGLMVYASDPTERFVLMYAHLDRYADGLVEGMPLRQGDRLGDVGTTGNAPPDTPHLHFAITRSGNVRAWWKGRPVNPFSLLAPGAPLPGGR